MKRFSVFLGAAALCGALALSGCAATEPYTPAPKAATVADEALVTAGTLTVGVDTSQGKAPLAGVASTGKVVGMDVDLATWLADELGLKILVMDVSADPAAALAERKVDVVLGMPVADAIDGLWLSDVYLPTAVALFSLDKNAEVPASDSNPQISAEAAKVSAFAVANEFGGEALVAGIDMGEVFEMLRDGSVQYAAADALIGMYAANTVHCDAYPIALMQKTAGYCAAVSAENTALQEALASALRRVVSNGVLDRMVETRWLGKVFDLDGVPYTELALQFNGEEGEGEGEEGEAGEGEEGAEGGEEGEGEGGEAAA